MYMIKNTQSGLIRTILIIVFAIFLLSYFGIDLQKAVESQQAQKNIGYVKAVVITVWERYLERPLTYVGHIFIDYIWNPLIRSLKKNANTTTTELIIVNPLT